ncbi:probable calcium-binding protein CML41 [Diospyros lotus]|uniref:probable calcium-binding protein CML41 n=1 Tax=Diospyros lotus TaxID=55363 RepID=UPI00224F6D5E|nr:probable calcium-binding protein CML41 [Diospyros lotus]
MEPAAAAAAPSRVPKSFGCLPHRGLKLSLHRLKSSKSSSSTSSSSPRTPTQKNNSNSSREDEFRQVFHCFDSDNDGKISALELRAYFGSVGEYMSHEEAQSVIDDLDADGDNLVDLKDFLKLMMKKEGEEDIIKAAFEMFECEKGCGRITPKGLQRVLSRLGDPKSYNECVAMIQVFDTDGNGELDLREFHQMMASP